MKAFNFEDRFFDPDSLLLCNIGPVGNNPQVPGNIPVDDDSTVRGAGKKEKTDGTDLVPPAEDKEAVDKKIPLEEPKKEITAQNTEELIADMDKSKTAIIAISELLQEIIKMNRERKDMEIKMLWTECENVCNNIQTQADNIRTDAVKNLVVGLVTSTVSVVCGAMSIGSAASGLKELNAAESQLQQTINTENITVEEKGFAYQQFSNTRATVETRTQLWNGISQVCNALSQAGSAVSDYFSKQMEAQNKEIDATNEVLRTGMEEIKKAIDDARNSILSAQQNANELHQTHRQTMNKVMG